TPNFIAAESIGADFVATEICQIAVDNFVDVRSPKNQKPQQASTTHPYLLGNNRSIFASEFVFFNIGPNLPSKQRVAGSSPAGRANVFNHSCRLRVSKDGPVNSL